MSQLFMDELKIFDIYPEQEDRSVEIYTVDLLDEGKCRAFLEKQMVEMKAPSLSVAASMLSKRYAYLVVSSTLYSMGKYNGVVCLPIKGCALCPERKLHIQANMCKWQIAANRDREQWREKILQGLFTTHITPVLQVLQKVSRLPSSILWENVAIRVNSIYRKALAKAEDQIQIERLKSDFTYLQNARGTLFNLQENPISHFLKSEEQLKVNPIRKTCCMYYKLAQNVEGISYCGNCPIKRKKQK